MYDLPHVAGCEPHNPHAPRHNSCVGSVLHTADLAQHIQTAG